jgi:hypothetical protein
VGPEYFPAVPYPEPVIVPPPWEGGDGNAAQGFERSRLKVSSA